MSTCWKHISLFVVCFPGNDWNSAAVSLKRRGQPYNHTGTLNVPRIVSRRRLGVVFGICREHPSPSSCLSMLSLLIMPPLVTAISHILVMWYVKCKPLLLWYSPCNDVQMYYNPQTLKNVPNSVWRQSGDAPPYLSFCGVARSTWEDGCSPDMGRWVGRYLVGTFSAERQGGGPERNVPTLRFREVALNVLPAGSKFEDVSDVFAAEPLLQRHPIHFQSRRHLMSWICAIMQKTWKQII